MNIDSILDTELDWRHKAFPSTPEAVTVRAIAAQGWNLLNRDLLLPALVVKAPALDHNIRLMARFCRRHGISHCPHVKTPMAPQVVRRQIAAGAWGVTAASVSQARIFRKFGVRRILIANQVVDPGAIDWIGSELSNGSGVELFCLVDSIAAVRALSAVLDRVRPERRLPVLLEWGVPGGRAGVRALSDAVEVATAVRESPSLKLGGVEGYEGSVRGATFVERLAGVDAYVKDIRMVTEELDGGGAFTGLDEVIVSVGGSTFTDKVAEELCGAWRLRQPVRVVLRAGSYAFHDLGEMEEQSALAGRSTQVDRLKPALELWATVLSRPEPALVIVGFGKRDVSYDIGLPIPFASCRDGHRKLLPTPAKVVTLNDQHACVEVDHSSELEVGDLLGCSISHPCTALDKWKLLPVVDDDYAVTGAIMTYF